MCIGEEIKTFLENNGIKQAHVSQKTGIPAAKLSLSLAGKRKLSTTEYAAICGVLGVDANTFIHVPQHKTV